MTDLQRLDLGSFFMSRENRVAQDWEESLNLDWLDCNYNANGDIARSTLVAHLLCFSVLNGRC